MNKAFDTLKNKIVSSTETEIKYTVRANDKRFICPCCGEYVTLTKVGHNIQHFKHKKKDDTECDYRLENTNYQISRYYDAKTLFALPIYLVKSRIWSLNLGILMTKSANCKVKYSDDSTKYDLVDIDITKTKRFYYFHLFHFSSTYYVSFSNDKIAYGEGIKDLNMFYIKTGRLIREEEKIYSNESYYFTINTEYKHCSLISNVLEDKYKALSIGNLEANNGTLKIFYVEAKAKELKVYIAKLMNKTLSVRKAQITFYWPLHYREQDKVFFFYDNEILFNIDNTKTLNNLDGEIISNVTHYIPKNFDAIIGSSDEDGFVANTILSNQISYSNKFSPSIKLTDINSANIMDEEALILKDFRVVSNIKCKVVIFGKEVKVLKPTYSKGGFFEYQVNIVDNDYFISIVYQNRVYKRLFVKKKDNKVITKLSLNKILLLARNCDLVPVNKEKLFYIFNKINNLYIKRIIYKYIKKGFISRKLQNYIIESGVL